MTPQEDRAIDLHTAKVLLTEAMKRRASGRSHATLLLWAGNARRRAAVGMLKPPQGDLFSSQHQTNEAG